MYSFQPLTDYSNNIVLISAEDSAILSVILSLFDFIFVVMSFSSAISISDSKLFWLSEALSLVFSSHSLVKHLSHVHCVMLSVTMNLYAAYKLSYAAAHSLYSGTNLKVHDKQFLHVVLADASATSVYSFSDSKLSESLSFIFSSSPFFRSL